MSNFWWTNHAWRTYILFSSILNKFLLNKLRMTALNEHTNIKRMYIFFIWIFFLLFFFFTNDYFFQHWCQSILNEIILGCNVETHKINIWILVNQTKFGLSSHFFDWYDTKRNFCLKQNELETHNYNPVLV